MILFGISMDSILIYMDFMQFYVDSESCFWISFRSLFGWPGSGWIGCAGPGLAGAGLVEAGTGVAGANMGLGLAWE